MSSEPTLTLGFEGFSIDSLYDVQGLSRLHGRFLEWLAENAPEACAHLEQARVQSLTPEGLSDGDRSALVLDLGPWVGAFVAKLFGVEQEVELRRRAHGTHGPVLEALKKFVKPRVHKRRALKGWAGSDDEAQQVWNRVVGVLGVPEGRDASLKNDRELCASIAVLRLLEVETVARKMAKAGGASWEPKFEQWVGQAKDALPEEILAVLERGIPDRSVGAGPGKVQTAESNPPDDSPGRLGSVGDCVTAENCVAFGDWATVLLEAMERALVLEWDRQSHWPAEDRWASLFQPKKQKFDALVPLRRHREDLPEALEGAEHRRQRVEPFALTDTRMSHRHIEGQVDYCLYCHSRDKDSCSKGLRSKQGEIKKNPLGVDLNGCPLYEKISEMHLLRKAGEFIGSLATITLDNPMAAGTGHRICNDCMKACVYQVQEPVNIPAVETQALVDVLELPWGFEIYSLLTRWNPLNVTRPVPRAYHGHHVMVVGMGPAGYTLAHHLLNEGFGVVGVDGLKLEPLPGSLLADENGHVTPVYDFRQLQEPLESRTTLGFGGVSEYGITVRWDKTFLSVIYLMLLRQPHFRAHGGVRFGGTVTLEDAWAMGFDHVGIAAGAGKPTLIPMKGNLMRGIRKASDLLMGLQLTGAYKRESLANLQVRLPAVVIGGGLTAIDTATELAAYYVVQVEKVARWYDALAQAQGEESLRESFSEEELEVVDEMRSHGAACLGERQRASQAGEEPDLQSLVRQWGGVRIAYRRRLEGSPAYRLNHEEVEKSLEEGIEYVELMSPVEAHADKWGAVEAVTFDRMELNEEGRPRKTGSQVRLPARTVAVAAGTGPNTGYEEEHPGSLHLGEDGYYVPHRAVRSGDGSLELVASEDASGVLTDYHRDGRFVSFYGDNHPKYAGSVVKAMASAKDGFGQVVSLFDHEGALDRAAPKAQWQRFADTLSQNLQATVDRVQRLAPGIVEVVVKAPLAARKFRPGQFYRFQTFERDARRLNDVPLVTEGLALTGASTEPGAGLLSTIALEMGTSSRMLAHLQPGDPVVLMGPTGEPTEIPEGETVLLAGGGLGNAVLFSIAKALQERGSRSIYFAGYRHSSTLFKRDMIEAHSEQVIWTSDAGDAIEPQRTSDRYFRGNIVEAMVAHQKGELGEVLVDLRDVDRVIAIGSDGMMNAVKHARSGVLKPYLKPCHRAIGSINSPMQCMMKAICAQCLQRVVDEDGTERMIYICSNQDQDLDRVDFVHLKERLKQNSAEEKLSNLWWDHRTS